MNIAEYKKLAKRKHKYSAKPVKADGIQFDSKLEASRYHELKLLEKAGQICELQVHPMYVLRVAANADAVTIGHCEFDFAYYEVVEPGVRGPIVIEDAKGCTTPLGKWKLKHFEAQQGTKVRIIKSTKVRAA